MYRISIDNYFKRAYKKLDSAVQKDFQNKIKIFMQNPFQPQLHTHQLLGRHKGKWTFYLRAGYRVWFYFQEPNHIILVDIASHDKYKKR